MSDKKNKEEKKREDKKISELELLQKKSAEYLEGWQRAKADYINLKKQSEARQTETIQFANAALISELLPIIENYKTAMQHVPDDIKEIDWMKGFEYVQKQFITFLDELGIREIKTVGQKFDPNLHEALAAEEKDDYQSDVIFEEIKAGYTLHGKVVVPAKVKVAK